MIAESVAIVFFALFLDLAFGDPNNRFHPTAWLGMLIARLAPVAQTHHACRRLAGVYVVVIPVLVVVSLLALLEWGIGLITGLAYTITLVLVMGILFKMTLAIHGMNRHAMNVVAALDANDLLSARQHLAMIVKRDTTNLDSNHIYSAVVESISENTVDGVTGPLFYFGFFGIFGSFVYRTVNTADSMVGYRTSIFRDMGWFAATSDMVLNYIPSRLTGLMMVLSSALLQDNWRESYRTMIRDSKNTESPNAGYPMAAVAGALDARLEKIGHYSIGSGTTLFSKRHVIRAITMMKVTSIVFAITVVIPAMTLMSYIGWWVHA